MRKKMNLYLYSVLLFMLIFPIISILLNIVLTHNSDVLNIIGKWFVFWGIGMRLLTAGIKQVITPSFTVKQVMNVEDNESNFFVRELGHSNISIGLAGVISLLITQWCIPVAFIGGLFLGIAGIQHVIKKPSGVNESVAMYSDLFIFLIMTIYIIQALCNNSF